MVTNPVIMKTKPTLTLLFAAIFSVQALTAQTVYNINTNKSYSAAGIPTQCTNCAIQIADGVTLTIDKDVYLQNVSFTGGANNKSSIVVKDNNVTFWATGSFTNINASFQKSNFTNSSTITLTNSNFTFTKTSLLTAYSSLNLVSSTIALTDDAGIISTGGTVGLTSSSIVVGDGSPSSNAYMIMNGGGLMLSDATSFVTMATNNNQYFNWSGYTAINKTIKTVNNNLNCGGHKNACAAPLLYGPAALTASGVSSSAILPVKLVSFSAKTKGNTVVLNWTTAQEINSSVFEIERSVDGLNWTKAGSVSAKGNSIFTTTYSFSEILKGGNSFSFRLKMVDADNEFEYSSIVKVSLNSIPATIKTFPNPATEFFAIDGSYERTQVQLLNMNGAVVKIIGNYAAGTRISLNGVNAGNYVVKVTDATGTSQALRMVVAK